MTHAPFDSRIQKTAPLPRRQYDFGDTDDQRKLKRLRDSTVTCTRRTVAESFEALCFDYRINRREIRRLCGPGIISNTRTDAARFSGYRHDVAVAIVRLRAAADRGIVGEWAHRTRDGTRSRLRLDDVPDMAFNTPTDWLEVCELVRAHGWSRQAFAQLVGTQPSVITQLSWGRQSPRMTMGERVLWGAWLVAHDIVFPPPDGGQDARPIVDSHHRSWGATSLRIAH